MPIQVECPSCRSSFRVGEDYAGKRGKCPRCREPIVVPGPSDQDEGLVPIAPPATLGRAAEESEGYEVAGVVRKARAVAVRGGGSGVVPEGVARAVEPARPTQ